MKKRCTSCHGYKELRKIGNVMGKCEACKGTGTIEVKEPKSEKEAVEQLMSKLNDSIVTSGLEEVKPKEIIRSTNTEALVASISKEVTKHGKKSKK